jgi:signal transduction histidine kinase
LNLDSICGDKIPHATFFLAIVGTVWLTRTGPAVLSSVAGLFLADYFFTSPRYTPGFTTHAEWLSALSFILVAAGVLVFAGRERRALAREERTRQDILSDMTNRKRAEIRLDLLVEAASQLLKSREPQYVVDALCQKVMSFLECDVFFNFLIDEAAGGKLRLNAWGGIPEQDAKAIEWLEPGVAVCGCAAKEGNRIIAEDIQRSEDPRTDLVRGMGVQAYACHPLKVQDRVLGTLSFGTRSRPRFKEDELALMKAVADMVAIAMERKRARQELQRINADLEQRVAERTQTLRELAEQLNAFCYTLAHDLRAPLRTQLSFARMLLIDYGDKLGETGKDWAGRVVQAAERQSNIIQDLLAHITVSRTDLPLGPVELTASVEHAQADLKLELEQKDASVQCEGLNGLRVLANASSLHLIVLNLLTNAVKFVAPGQKPEVRVWAEPRGGFVRLCVQDNGIGISRQDVAKLFGPFQRLNRSSDYPGTGLGLAIVKKATERMGGRVGIESEPGQGSRFWVELPPAP